MLREWMYGFDTRPALPGERCSCGFAAEFVILLPHGWEAAYCCRDECAPTSWKLVRTRCDAGG